MEIFQYKHFPFPVTRVVLPSGLTVFIVKKESKITLAQISFAAGSLDDGDLPGTAHFLEHILYEGPSHDGIHPKLRHLFVKGVETNASTGLAYTDYWVKGFSENFSDILRALFSIVFDATFSEASLNKERSVILQEIRQGNFKKEFMLWFYKTLYPDIPALHCACCGTQKSVRKIKKEDLRKFHDRWYQPENAALIVVGSIPGLQVIETVSRFLDSFPSKKSTQKNHHIKHPKFVSRERKDDGEQEQLIIYFPEPEDREYQLKLAMASKLLIGTPFGILYEKLRLKDRCVYGIRINDSAWPTLHSTIETPAQQKYFPHIEEEIFKGIDRLVRCEYSDDLFKAVRAEDRMTFTTMREGMRSGKIVDILSSQWIENRLSDIDVENIVLTMNREDVANTTREYWSREKYGSISIIHK